MEGRIGRIAQFSHDPSHCASAVARWRVRRPSSAAQWLTWPLRGILVSLSGYFFRRTDPQHYGASDRAGGPDGDIYRRPGLSLPM